MLGIFFMGKCFLDCGENQVQDNKTTRGAGVKTCSSFCIYSVFLLGDIGNNGCANSVLLLLCMV